MTATSTFDRAALRQGASVALVFALPFSIGSRLLADHSPDSPWIAVLWLLALGGFALGAGIAFRLSSTLSLIVQSDYRLALRKGLDHWQHALGLRIAPGRRVIDSDTSNYRNLDHLFHSVR